MMPEVTVYEVALAALLHDIGKLMQRADTPLSPEGQRLQTLSDVHAHVHFTGDFFQRYLKGVVPPGINLITAENLAVSHHDPQCTGCALLIQLADRASAALDRPAETAAGAGWKAQRLLAPFADVAADTTASNAAEFVQLLPLDFNGVNVFPDTTAAPQDRTREYQRLWEGVQQSLRSLPATTRNLDIWLGALTSLLERYTWCVPSYTQSDRADISLFDHAVTTAGIACALFRYHELCGEWHDHALRSEITPRLRLIAADVSGIQEFIQNVPARIAKHRREFHLHLRARSFVISLFTDIVLHKLCRALTLPRVCTWIRHGGRLMLLAPNTPLVDETLVQVQREVDEWLVANMFGELRLHLDASVAIALEDFRRANFSTILTRAAAAVYRQKCTPFATLLKSTAGWNTARFRIQASATEETPFEESTALPYPTIARLLTQPRVVINYLPPHAQGTFLLAGVPVTLSTKVVPDAEYAEAVNDWRQGLPTVFVANYVKTEDHRPVSFDELAGVAEEGRHGYLLVLKGDVDGLGRIFAAGREDECLSRYLFRSRMLHYFFAGHLTNLMQERYGKSYTVYAGGDDFFLITHLDTGLHLLHEAYYDFRRYTSQRLTFSAAAAPYKTNSPLRTGFRLAEAWLSENAKHVEQKNRLVAYHTIVSWDTLRHLLEVEKELWNLLHAKDINNAFLQRLLLYADMHAQATRGERRVVTGLLYKPRLLYDITRNVAKARPRNERQLYREKMKHLLAGNKLLDEDTLMNALRIPVTSLMYQQRSSR